VALTSAARIAGGCVGAPDGQRYTKAFRGTLSEARKELRRLLKSADDGVHIAPATLSLGEYVRGWLDGANDLSPKTLERYRQLAEQQIIPHLGVVELQKLRPAQIQEWHAMILKTGGMGGRPLSARTVGHAHRLLHRALERAMRLEIIARNVAHVVRPPKVEASEVAILAAAQLGNVLTRLVGHAIYPIVALALATGMRRGELCGVAWGAVDLNAATIRVERSLEETAAGLRFKSPKTRHGYRTISLPASAVELLGNHRRQQIEQRLMLGLGRLGSDDLVFALPDGSPYPPDKLSRDWGNTVRALRLPRIMFHALRHSHASALIAAGLDIVTAASVLAKA
jgi:integrase